MKKLPEKWSVIITEQNREVLEKYRSKLPKVGTETCLDEDALGKWLISDLKYTSYMYWGCETGGPENYTEISFEDFETLVLGKTPKITPKEDYTYLVGILQTIK